MAQKNTQQNTQSQTALEAPQSASGNSEPIRAGVSAFALLRGAEGSHAAEKVQFMGDIRQKLAEVADAAKGATELSGEAEQLADNSATRLYQARVRGMLTADELSGLLGDVFGYKPKQDGTPGKTPAGTGEIIRKRIVRLHQGYSFVNGGDGGRFFETMSPDDVAPIINRVGAQKDGLTIWGAFKALSDIKSQVTVRIPFAFDPKKILGLVDSLSEAGARNKVLSNPVLLRAYGGLLDAVNVLTTLSPEEAKEVAERLGVASTDEVENEEMAA